MDGFDLPTLRSAPPRAILAICGGGYAGLFAAEFLRRLEGRLGRPLQGVFDLVAGTSVGGLLALGVAAGKPATELVKLVEGLGPRLFGKGSVGAFRPKHPVGPLRAELEAVFGGTTLSQLGSRVLVPSVDLTAGQTILFRNGPADPTRDALVVNVALATSAAPVYLPPHAADDRLYADGGLAANSPEAVAAIEGVHACGWEKDRITMVVVGSTRTCARVPGHLASSSWGLARWLSNDRLMTETFRAQMSLARQTALSVLGDARYVVADVTLSAEEQAKVGLDEAGKDATAILKSLAAVVYDDVATKHATILDRLAR